MEPKITQLEDYVPIIGEAAAEHIRKKAAALAHLRVVHVNSTYYGGGVAELLTSPTLLMNSTGILIVMVRGAKAMLFNKTTTSGRVYMRQAVQPFLQLIQRQTSASR